ncbi:hypothetical protein CGRA01v4_09608 [Colletotrichum graminicola]|nr:hypothetical protein CGRA01v4_09608 [Colletotrichum graminicola]
MCVEHKTVCPVCRRLYLVYVAFCHAYHPPLLNCPQGLIVQPMQMLDGRCPSPVCPNSRIGGCAVI